MIAKDGRIAQMMAVNDTAWTQRLGNGHWDSIECEGHAGEYLTGSQIEGIAQIFAWGHNVRGWPLQVASNPYNRGLGHHSMGAENGIDWGHSQCPGEPIKSQKPAIVARAIEIVSPTTEEDLPPVFVWCEGVGLCLVDGGLVVAIKTTAGWQKVFAQRGWDWKLIQGGREVQVTREELDSMGILVDKATFLQAAGVPRPYKIELSGATGTATPV